MKQKACSLPPPGSAAAPNYWCYETGGELRPAMQRYLDSQPLTRQDIDIIRAYLRQWIGSAVWDRNPYANAESKTRLARLRASIEDLVTVKSIRRWIDAATAEGLDPL
jgi:hypothetical protein